MFCGACNVASRHRYCNDLLLFVQLVNSGSSVVGLSQAQQQLQDVLAKQMEQVGLVFTTTARLTLVRSLM